MGQTEYKGRLYRPIELIDMSPSELADWVVEICYGFGCSAETAHYVAAEFAKGVRTSGIMGRRQT